MTEINDKRPDLEQLLKGFENDSDQDTTDEEPEFITKARIEARERGVHVEAVLREQALEALRNATYPTPACLKPYELELLSWGETLTPDRISHAESCIPCRRFMRAANSKAQNRKS